MAYKRYGNVWVTISAVITAGVGITFWTLMDEPYIDAQALAEAMSGIRERVETVVLEEDEEPSDLYTSEPSELEAGVTIEHFSDWDTLYNYILVPSRTLLIGASAPKFQWYMGGAEMEEAALVLDFYREWEYVDTDSTPIPDISTDTFDVEIWELDEATAGALPGVTDLVYTAATRWPWPDAVRQSGVTATNAAFANLFTPGAPLASEPVLSVDLQAADGPWADLGLGDNMYRLDCEITNSVGQVVDVSQYIAQTNLLQAGIMMSAMSTTVHVVTLTDCLITSTTITEKNAYVSSNATSSVEEDVTPVMPPLVTDAVYQDMIETVSTNQTTYPGGFFSSRISDHSFGSEEMAATYVRDHLPPNPPDTESWTYYKILAYYDGEDLLHQGVITPYPSTYACTNGLVKRVRVFGIFTASESLGTPYLTGLDPLRNEPPDGINTGDDWGSVSLDYGTRITGVPSYSQVFTTASVISAHPGKDLVARDGYTQYYYSPSSPRPEEFRITLLYEEDEVTNRPSFNIGDESEDGFILSGGDYISMQWDADRNNYEYDPDTYPGRLQTVEAETFSGEARFVANLQELVIVTEWGWTHMDKDNPYEVPAGETNNPAYIEDNLAPF